MYPHKEVPNKTTVHRLVTNFGTEEAFISDVCSSSGKTADITFMPMSSSASAATAEYVCKNSGLAAGFVVLCLKVFMSSR
jgi:hypothetical protein